MCQLRCRKANTSAKNEAAELQLHTSSFGEDAETKPPRATAPQSMKPA